MVVHGSATNGSFTVGSWITSTMGAVLVIVVSSKLVPVSTVPFVARLVSGRRGHWWVGAVGVAGTVVSGLVSSVVIAMAVENV